MSHQANLEIFPWTISRRMDIELSFGYQADKPELRTVSRCWHPWQVAERSNEAYCCRWLRCHPPRYPEMLSKRQHKIRLLIKMAILSSKVSCRCQPGIILRFQSASAS